jgi:hypothetical protein
VFQQHRHEYAAGFPMASRYGIRIPPGSSRRPRGQWCALRPARIRQVRAGDPGEGRKNAASSRTPFRHARRTRPVWQCQDVPALSGLLPPSPPPRGSGCPQLQRPAATGHKRRSLTSTRITAPHGANEIGARSQIPDPKIRAPLTAAAAASGLPLPRAAVGG